MIAHKWDATLAWKQESKWRLFNYSRNNSLVIKWQ